MPTFWTLDGEQSLGLLISDLFYVMVCKDLFYGWKKATKYMHMLYQAYDTPN